MRATAASRRRGPVALGTLGSVVALDGAAAFSPRVPQHAVVGELRAVVGLSAVTTGPHAPPAWPVARGVWRFGRRWEYAGEL